MGLEKQKLLDLQNEISLLLSTEINEIIVNTRRNMVVVEEKSDGDSATIADVKIGELLEEKLIEWLPGSLVIQEESFCEQTYNKIKGHKFIWVVDPIDGTKAFRTENNNEYCVGIALLENFNPILSFVYSPEYETNFGKGFLACANKFDEGIIVNGRREIMLETVEKRHYVSHLHKETVRNKTEEMLAEKCDSNEQIRAYDGHSTLVQYALVAIEKGRVFSRRGANIWDIVQGAYLVEKSGGMITYEDGTSIFPIDYKRLQYENNHLIMPFNVASDKNF